MSSGSVNLRTQAFVAIVATLGGAVAWALCADYRPERPWFDLATFLVFSVLGVFWTLLTFKVGTTKKGSLAISLAPACYQALVPIAPPALVIATACLLSMVDWIAHKRHAPAAIFNLGQTIIGAGLAVAVSKPLLQVLPGHAGVACAALCGAAAYSAVSFLTTPFVIHLATGKPLLRTGVLSYAALTNETVLACFSSLMALTWFSSPWLLAVAALPLTLLFLLLSRLEKREISLEKRQQELQSIQELGLEVSAQLDEDALARIVTRIVAEDLRACGALLATLGENNKFFEVRAIHDAREAPGVLPTRIMRRGMDERFLERAEPLLGESTELERLPELAVLNPSSFIAQPLSVLGHPGGVLVVFDAGSRDPFSAADCRRLSGLVRFIEVSLNNARLYEDLRQAQEQLVQREKLSALGELVSGVAHELNNPLATVMGSSELLETHDLPQTSRRTVAMIRREADRAARIVRNLLTFSRQSRPDLGWHDVGAVIQEIVQLRQYELQVGGIELRANLSPEVPPLRLDTHQIHQVLVNLVNNAAHAIEETGQPGTILLRTYKEGERAFIEVTDDGPGIPEDVLPKIFNPFFTTKRVGKGTGLGLSICYGIVQAHDGAFRVRSTPGEGSTFTIDLPLPTSEEIDAARTEPSGEDAHAEREIDGDGRLILVVDDEEGIRETLNEALSLWGFETRMAASGEEALEALESCDPVLIVTDLRMPGLDGPGLYRGVHGRRGDDAPPFVFLTGDAASDEVRSFLDGVGAEVLVKPFSLGQLKDVIPEECLVRTSIS